MDTFGAAHYSVFFREFWMLKCTSIIEKGPQSVSFIIERLSSLWRIKCNRFGSQSMSFIEGFFLLCHLFRVSIIRHSTIATCI